MTNIKAIFGLLVAAVAAGAFAVATSAGYTGSSPRSGALHVTKECSEYAFAAGSFCTIRSSNLNAIKGDSRVVYASAPGDPTPGLLDSDLVIDGPGNNNAHGHVVLDLETFTGVVTFAGGTGRFPQISGLRVQFHCNGTTPVVDGIWKTPGGASDPGTLVGPADTIRFVTNDFMFTGGDGYTVFASGTNVSQPGDDLLEVTNDYIKAHSPVDPVVEGRIVTAP